jgi:hypothetical protein
MHELSKDLMRAEESMGPLAAPFLRALTRPMRVYRLAQPPFALGPSLNMAKCR